MSWSQTASRLPGDAAAEHTTAQPAVATFMIQQQKERLRSSSMAERYTT